jgi:hypothetical protein
MTQWPTPMGVFKMACPQMLTKMVTEGTADSELFEPAAVMELRVAFAGSG